MFSYLQRLPLLPLFLTVSNSVSVSMAPSLPAEPVGDL